MNSHDPQLIKSSQLTKYYLQFFPKNLMIFQKTKKLFVYVQNLEREINNGGFNQYFFNSSGDYARETVQALKEIKANKTAPLLEKAIQQFPDSNFPSDRTERQDIMEKIEDKADEVWDRLDNNFYKYEDNIAELLLDFVKNNIDDFSH